MMLRTDGIFGLNPTLARIGMAAVSYGAILLLSGCGGESTAGTTKVNGIVTLDGAAVDGASVAFTGNNGAKLATAQTDSAGKFTIRAALGTNVITIAKEGDNPAAAPTSDGLMPADGEYQKMVKKQGKPGVPAKYSDPKTSGLKMDISDGMPTVELELVSK